MSINSQNNFTFEIKSVKLKGIDVIPQSIGEVNIYESIQSPAIVGDFTILDWNGFDEVGEIFAGDDIEFTIASVGKDEIKLKFKIFAGASSADSGNTVNPISYRFCSPWAIDGYTRQISKAYKDKYVHEIIEDLLKECGADIGFIEPTKQKLNRFTTPLWTPIHSIYYLLSFVLNEEDKAGYVIWTDLNTKKTNVTTLDYLFQGKYGKEKTKFMSLPLNEYYDSRMEDVSFESNFDVIKHGNLGSVNTILQCFNYDNNKAYVFDKTIEKIPYTRLSKKFPLNKSFLDRKYASIKTSYIFPSKDSLVVDKKMFEDLVDGKAKNRYAKIASDVFKLNLTTQPNSTRRVGHLAEVEYLSSKKENVTKNKIYSGMYLIRNIRWMIHNNKCVQAVTLIADGYKESKNELVTW